MLVSVYREDRRAVEDKNVLKVVDALIQYQRRVATGKTPILPEKLSDNEQLMFDRVLGMMEERRAMATPEQKAPKRFSVLKKVETIDDILLACLRRIHKSVKFWNKEHGRQGYLQYVIQFLP